VNLVFLFPGLSAAVPIGLARPGFNNPFSWALYCGLLVATSAANIALVLVSTRGGGRLMAAR
jgi:hypothetical protein